MADEYIGKHSAFTATADAIREKGKSTDLVTWDEETGFEQAVLAIQSGGAYPQLIVTAPAGSTITAVNGEETVTGVIGTEGTLTLDLPAFGPWTVTATLDEREASTTIEVAQEYPVELAYETTFTVNGGVNETVTISLDGATLATVALDSTGTGTFTLESAKGKTLTFTGGTSGFEKMVTASGDPEETVNVYPDGALYWHGRMFDDITGGWKVVNSTGGNGAILDDSMRISYSGSSGRDSAVYTNNKIDFQKIEFNTLYACVNITYASNAITLGVTQNNPSASVIYNGCVVQASSDTTGKQILNVPVSSIQTGEYYIGIGADVSNAYVYEVWLE